MSNFIGIKTNTKCPISRILRIQPFRQQYKRPAPYLQIDTARVFYMGNPSAKEFLHEAFMNFYAIGKGVMVEVHGGIMKSRFRIFAQCDESRFQFRFHFRIPEEVFSSRGDDRRDAGFFAKFGCNHFPDDLRDFRCDNGRRCLVQDGEVRFGANGSGCIFRRTPSF